MSLAHETTGKSGRIEKEVGLRSTSSIKVTRKAPLKSMETIKVADEERVSVSAKATKPAVASCKVAEEDDFQEPPQLQIDLNQRQRRGEASREQGRRDGCRQDHERGDSRLRR